MGNNHPYGKKNYRSNYLDIQHCINVHKNAINFQGFQLLIGIKQFILEANFALRLVNWFLDVKIMQYAHMPILELKIIKVQIIFLKIEIQFPSIVSLMHLCISASVVDVV